jgi:phosphoribosylglycinamide formyltransferase-1
LTRIGILLSGRGSNFLAIEAAIRRGEIPDAAVAVVLSNRADAPGLEAAKSLGLPAKAALREHEVELVCLAGYMRIISAAFVAAFPNRILNIHPSLLPSFPGLDAQAQALAFGAKVAGCTVHFVDEQVDHGVIVLQRTVEVRDKDTAETLSARILAEEHQAYPEALRRVISGNYTVQGRRYVRGSDADSVRE